MREGPRRRLQFLGLLLIGCALVVVVRLVQIQIVDHHYYKAWAERQRRRAVMVDEPSRGVIRDRDGHVLAGNFVRYAVEATPKRVTNKRELAAILAPVLGTSVDDLERKLSVDKWWVRLASSVSEETKRELEALELPHIDVRPQWIRSYPEGSLASHVLGFSSAEGRGYYGVESFYDDYLRPEPAEREARVDSVGDLIPWEVVPVVLPQPGATLELTLDRTVQAIVEEELARSVQEYQARGGTVIVMDPRTFGILASASWPEYDPERYGDFIDVDVPFEDPAISQQYEPGSVFKILTVAAALDAGIVTPETTYYDQGHIEVGGRRIENASHDAYGEQSVADILIESLNVGAAWLAVQTGSDTFYRYVQSFGIGQLTGIDLAGEIKGRLWLPSDYEHWYASNLGVNAFGQAVAVTPLQMITAVATVANDGVRLRPYIVDRRVRFDGTISTHQPVVEGQVISPETARTLTDLLARTVEDGVPEAQVEGYQVAGKTGTAQVPIPGGYAKDETITSFVGFGPVSDPQVIILVKLDRPQTSTWASHTAAPTFQRLASRLFPVLGIPPGDEVGVAEAVR